MQNFASLNLNSLKKMAAQFQRKNDLQKEKKDEEANSAVKSNLSQIIQSKVDEEDNEEEYLEFPVLKKHKTYSAELLKPQKNDFPERLTVLKAKNFNVEIQLQDTELFESSTLSRELQPIVLRNSHAIFTGFENLDEVVFNIDVMGYTHVKMTSKSVSESFQLGCIVRYELKTELGKSLVVSSRNLDSDVEVLGGPCKIEFYLPAVNKSTEEAKLRRLELKDELSQLNEEAGRSIYWLL